MASDRISALGFGAGDFMREMGEGFTITKMSPEEYFPVLLYARSSVATAACAAGISAIDTPFLGLLTDTVGLEQEAAKVKRLGFKGKMVTHPRQIKSVNMAFSPSEDDVAFSNKIIEAYKSAEAEGKGAAVLEGKMIDVAMYRMAMDVLNKVKKLHKKTSLNKK
jgi:citrate lyase subunit beta/citryl-CoA lyase